MLLDGGEGQEPGRCQMAAQKRWAVGGGQWASCHAPGGNHALPDLTPRRPTTEQIKNIADSQKLLPCLAFKSGVEILKGTSVELSPVGSNNERCRPEAQDRCSHPAGYSSRISSALSTGPEGAQLLYPCTACAASDPADVFPISFP